MTPGELQSLFANLKVWHGQGWRAPNKPLLALWAIGRCLRNEPRLTPYGEVARELGVLLRRFGPPRKRVNPDLPFWHLRRDGVWEVPEADRITETLSGHAQIGSLRREGAQGGLRSDVFLALRQDKVTALDIACSLLDAHFPDTLHDDILRAVGINTDYTEPSAWDSRAKERQETAQEFEQVRRRWRDPGFSKAVLDAYGDRCAVCAFSVRLHDAPVALDAAHIKWHRAGGRDRDKVRNGLSLCALHHRLFDAGAFTLSPKYTVITAPAAVGPGRNQSLEQFSRCSILLPEKTEDYPDWKSLKWHHREVFGPITEGVDYKESPERPVTRHVALGAAISRYPQIESWFSVLLRADQAERASPAFDNLAKTPSISATACSTSSSVVPKPRLKRTVASVSSPSRPIARKTCDGSGIPDAHAEPVEAARRG